MLGYYVNPDEIEAELREFGAIQLDRYDLEATTEELQRFLAQSALVGRTRTRQDRAIVEDGRIKVPSSSHNPYFASVASSFLRRKLLAAGSSFSFETVMSSPDKVQLLADARAIGYRTYLYFVAKEDPIINVRRVRNRVLLAVMTYRRTKLWRDIGDLWPCC